MFSVLIIVMSVVSLHKEKLESVKLATEQGTEPVRTYGPGIVSVPSHSPCGCSGNQGTFAWWVP